MTQSLLLAAGAMPVALASVSTWPVLAAHNHRNRSSADRARNVYEVEVTDANGLRLEAYIDPRSGEIVGQDDD